MNKVVTCVIWHSHIKYVFICSNPYIYTTVVQEVYNRDRSPDVDDVEGLAEAATKHLDLLKQKDDPESRYCNDLVHILFE